MGIGDNPKKKESHPLQLAWRVLSSVFYMLATRRCFSGGGVIVRGTPLCHAFPTWTQPLLQMHLPPSDASSASRLAFRTTSHHSPAFRLSSHSITWLLGPPPLSCNIPPLHALSRHTAAPSGCTVASSSRCKGNPLQPPSGLPTSRAASTLATPCPLLHATPPLHCCSIHSDFLSAFCHIGTSRDPCLTHI